MNATGPNVIANIDRLNAYLDRNDLAAVVARSGENFTYLAGFAYPGTLARHLDLPDSNRGVLAVWPREGEPTLIVNATAAGLAQRDSWIERIEQNQGYLESPYEVLVRVLRDAGLAEVIGDE